MAKNRNKIEEAPEKGSELPAWDVLVTGSVGPDPITYRVYSPNSSEAMSIALKRAHNDPRIYHVLETARPVRVFPE